MAGVEIGLGIVCGLVVIVLLALAITSIIIKISSREIDKVENIYLGKLANSDASIHNAMKYLKLTNGIKKQSNGEQK